MASVSGTSIPTTLFIITDQATGTIVNEDDTFVTVSDVTVGEAAGFVEFEFLLDADVAGGFTLPISVNVAPNAEITDFTLQTTQLSFDGYLRCRSGQERG